jgi:nitrogen fixation NifU-like protein
MEPTGPYTKKVIEHFRNPHNYGKIKNPSGVGKAGNFYCGDIMYLYIKVGKNKRGKEIIKDIKFETLGCVAAIGTSSVITDLVKGKTLEEAMKVDNSEVVKSLGGLPPIKIHCSVLAVDALSEAIYDYLSKNKKTITEELKKRHERIKREKEIIEKRFTRLNKI